MFKQNDIANLKNIIWAIEKIENSLIKVNMIEELVQNEEKFDSLVVKLMNIGESAYNISNDLKRKHPETDWDGNHSVRFV